MGHKTVSDAGKTAGIDIFIEISKEDNIVINCLPSNQLRIKLLKIMVRGNLASPRAQKNLEGWSLTAVPADRLELIG
jgi:hypothetical protein